MAQVLFDPLDVAFEATDPLDMVFAVTDPLDVASVMTNPKMKINNLRITMWDKHIASVFP